VYSDSRKSSHAQRCNPQHCNKEKQHKTATLKKLREAKNKIEKYNYQLYKACTRSGYNKIDTDTTAMMMKKKVEVLPAYNVLAGAINVI